jgi:hypothetical protein
MIAKIEKIAENLKLESQRIRHDAVARVRAFVLETAGAVARAKEPVRYFGSTGLKINDISHKTMAKLLKAQLTGLEDLVEGGAQRLQLAANASSFEDLVKGQIDAIPATRSRAIAHARRTLEIVRDTGDELSGVVKGTMAGAPKAASKATARRKPATRRTTATRKPAAKTATRKAPAAKKAKARKPAVRKATASRKKAVSKKAA